MEDESGRAYQFDVAVGSPLRDDEKVSYRNLFKDPHTLVAGYHGLC